jgi:hypothetical protein
LADESGNIIAEASVLLLELTDLGEVGTNIVSERHQDHFVGNRHERLETVWRGRSRSGPEPNALGERKRCQNAVSVAKVLLGPAQRDVEFPERRLLADGEGRVIFFVDHCGASRLPRFVVGRTPLSLTASKRRKPAKNRPSRVPALRPS